MDQKHDKTISYVRLHWVWIGVLCCLIAFGKLSRLELTSMQFTLLGLIIFLSIMAIRATSSGKATERGRKISTYYALAAGVYASLLCVGSVYLVALGYLGAELILLSVLALALWFFWIAAREWIRSRNAGPMVLFLRKFGCVDLNTAINRAFRKKLGRHRYRLITLNDALFEHGAASTKPVWLAALTMALLVTFSAAGGWAVYEEYKGAISESAIGMFAMLAGFVIVAGGFLAAGLALLVVLARYQVTSGRSALRSVASATELRSVLSILAGARTGSMTGLMVPRAMVISSSHELWKEAVLAFMTEADLVILDVSASSESIQWEQQQIKEQCAGKALLLSRKKSAMPAEMNSHALPMIAYDSYDSLVNNLRETLASNR